MDIAMSGDTLEPLEHEASDQLPPAQMPPRRLPVTFCRPAQMPAGPIAGRDNCRPADFRYRDIPSLLLKKNSYLKLINSYSEKPYSNLFSGL